MYKTLKRDAPSPIHLGTARLFETILKSALQRKVGSRKSNLSTYRLSTNSKSPIGNARSSPSM
jgi:hypothetical protein